MSHFTTIQTQIRDLDALNDACVELGLKFVAKRQLPRLRRHHPPGTARHPAQRPL